MKAGQSFTIFLKILLSDKYLFFFMQVASDIQFLLVQLYLHM